jgi:basic amino acid/polyamine antiporter, APA family
MFRKHHRENITLKRDLGLFDATLAGVGIIVGAGIYVLVGAASGLAGNMVWLSFIIAGIAALMTGLSYAELSSIYPKDDGEYSYVRHTFGKAASFFVAYLVVVSVAISIAAVALGFSGYLKFFFPHADMLFLAIASILLVAGINVLGVKTSMKLNILLTSLSILGLVVIIVLSVPFLGKVDYSQTNGYTGILKAASLIFFAYIGFESVVKLSEETKDPRRTIPLALLLSIGISTILYILVAFSAISSLGWERLAVSPSPLADVAHAIMGSEVSIIVALIAIVSTGNTVLLLIFTLSRMLYGLGEDYDKLKFLTHISKNTRTPLYAIAISALASIGFLFLGDIRTVAEVTNFQIFVVFAVINLAMIKSRYIKHRKAIFHEPLNIGKFPLIALLGFLVTVFLMLSLDQKIIIYGLLTFIPGLVFYRFFNQKTP